MHALVCPDLAYADCQAMAAQGTECHTCLDRPRANFAGFDVGGGICRRRCCFSLGGMQIVASERRKTSAQSVRPETAAKPTISGRCHRCRMAAADRCPLREEDL